MPTRPFVCLLAVVVALTQFASAHAEDAAEFRRQGIRALKESELNPRTITNAARSFAKAAELYAAKGDEAAVTEMNSFLYWCKKKMSLQDIDQFRKSGDSPVAEKLVAVEKLDLKSEEAQRWLERAEEYAKANPGEHFLIAVRFFEIASRFVGTKESIAAQERSLKEQALSRAQPPEPKPAVDPKPAKPGRTVNLLPLIDISKDAVAGKWSFADGVLTGSKDKVDRIEIPYRPPEEYDFRIVFMRMDGNDAVCQILQKGGTQFVWSMDGWSNTAAGIGNIDGKRTNENETTFLGKLITNGRWHTSLVQVRNSEITAFFDGKPILKYKTNYANISLDAGWKLRDASALGLGHAINKTAFSAIEVVEVTGTGKRTR